MKKLVSNKTISMFGMFAASAIMLTFIQAPFTLGWLGWIALVPFVYVCKKDESTWRIVIVSYLVSMAYWLANLYWIGYVTVPGYIVLALSLAFYWPVLGLCVRFFRRVKLPLVVGVPLIFVGAETWQGYFYTGFNWRLLGQSQWQALSVIQIADIFGTLGISFLVATVNGLVAALIIDCLEGKKQRLLKPINIASTFVVIAMVAGTVVYGNKRISETEKYIEQSPLIGSAQPNVPSMVKELSEAGDAILDDLIAQGKACFDAGAVMVVWPETIVLSTMNWQYVEVCKEDSRPVVFHNRIAELSKDNGYVLFGAHAVDVNLQGNRISLGDKYNSAFMYAPNGRQLKKRYDKIHLVPFGEYIPFKDSFRPLYNLALKMSPYEYDYSLAKGTEYTTFEITAEQKDYRFGTLICYEDTDPEVTRKMVVAPDGKKKADWLINISNDGWYVKYEEETVHPSPELSQRTVITIFRAVENRISIIRSVNTGISCVIDSVGRIRDGFEFGNLPERVMDRQAVAGWFVDRVDIDKRVTFFSLHGKILDKICGVFFVIVPILTVLHACIMRRKTCKSN